MSSQPGRRVSRLWYILLVVPFIGTLFPQFYDSMTPTFAGFPFYYWYQLLWVVISAVLTAIVYFATRS